MTNQTEVASDFDVVLPELHKKQAEFVRSIAKRKIVRAGRRGGKTLAVSNLAVEQFLNKRRILYGAPTTEQVETFWKGVANALAVLVEAKVFYKNETEHIIELLGTEQRIRAKTAWNADTLRGDYADVLILDEWQLMDEEAWEVVGAPMLLDNNGDAIFIYTPPSIHSRSVTKARDPRHAAKMFKKAQEDKSGRWAAFHWTSFDNPHLSHEALEEISQDMTVLAMRQEIYAEDIDKVPGALWEQKTIDDNRVSETPELKRIVVGVDPTGGTAEAGIVVAGLGIDNHGYLLEDASLKGLPEIWASKVVAAYSDYRADKIVAEKNFGGQMVEHTIRSVKGGKNLPIELPQASRGKIPRAEPIVAFYQRGMIHHVGIFADLEEQMLTYVPGNKSPDRMDAMVWAFTELMEGNIPLEKGDSKRTHFAQMKSISITENY